VKGLVVPVEGGFGAYARALPFAGVGRSLAACGGVPGPRFCVIMAAMSVVLVALFLVIAVVLAASFALGRTTHEVESARDTEYLELEGTWIRYAVAGGGPPIVLVHGWLSSSRIWERLAGRLAQRFTVYSLDLAGFGESDKPLSGYGVRNGSRLLYAFCAHFGLTRASVIGHDLGGAMAVKLAADHPDVVGRLVLVCAPADEDQIDLPTMLWLATLPVVGPIFYALGRAVRPVRKMWMRPFVADPGDLTEEVIDDAGRSTPAAAAQTLSIARREIARGRLARQARIIKIPLLVVAGEEDQIVDPQSVGVWAGGVDKAEICLIDGCGHLPMIERTAEFDAQVLAFLTGDARYLDYAGGAAADEDLSDEDLSDEDLPEDDQTGEETETRYLGESNEAYATDPSEPTDDTADLTPYRPDIEEAEPERREPPNVVRKRSGGYPPRNRAPQDPEDYLDGVQEDGVAEDFTEERPPPRDRATSSEDVIPELPRDLFDWPEAPGDFETRGRNRGSRREAPREEPNDEDHPDGPEGPARF
jgi:pimeloyl-ACP methyl ester carboxylesterase